MRGFLKSGLTVAKGRVKSGTTHFRLRFNSTTPSGDSQGEKEGMVVKKSSGNDSSVK